MADRGLLFYGMTKEEADKAVEELSQAVGVEIDVISATGLEDMTVEEILGNPSKSFFEAQSIRFIMFLGFTDAEIQASLTVYPSSHHPRPIFCSLTENNMSWKISKLAEHLNEEHTQHITE